MKDNNDNSNNNNNKYINKKDSNYQNDESSNYIRKDSNNNIKEKDNRLEVLRVISIFLVILIHVSSRYLRLYPNINDIPYFYLLSINIISRVCVPLFFMISGACLLGRSFDEVKYRKRIIRLIIILMFWTIFYYFTNHVNNPLYLVSSIFSYLKGNGHLWYMYAIIGLYITEPFISKMVKNMDSNYNILFIKLWLVLSGVVSFVRIILSVYNINTSIIHPVPLFNGTYYLGYFVFGYIAYNNYKNITFKKNNLIILSIIPLVINILLNFILTKHYNIHYEKLLTYSNILIMLPSVCVFLLALMFIDNKKSKIIDFITPNILGIYMFHVYLVEKFKPYFLNINPFFGIFISSFVIFILSLIFVYILKHIPVVKKYIV